MAHGLVFKLVSVVYVLSFFTFTGDQTPADSFSKVDPRRGPESLGRSRGPFGLSWELLGSVLGRFGRRLGAAWGFLGAFWDRVGLA